MRPSRAHRISPCAALVVLAAWLAPMPAFAKPPTPHASQEREEAARLRQEGNVAMDSGRPADALELYRRAYAIEADPALLYNQARAQQALTNYVDALDLLERFRREAPPSLVAKVTALDELVAELAGRIHTLTIQGGPHGTEIRVNGQGVGTLPLPGPLRLSAGAVLVEARHPGHVTREERVELAGGAQSDLSLVLSPVVTTGILVVRASEPGALVVVDDERRGGSPFEVTVKPGEHDVVVTRDGFVPAKMRVVVSERERREVTVPLEAKPGLLSRWWFWTAAGVVVLGGAATAFALTTERPAPTGSIPPGQVAVEAWRF